MSAVHHAASDTGVPARQDVRLRDLSLPRLLPLWAAGSLFAWYAIGFYRTHGTFGVDARSYWLTHVHRTLYGLAPGQPFAYLYTPAFAHAIWPIAHLPWPIFQSLWAAAEVAAYCWLLAPLGWRLGVPLLLLCTVELGLGNIYPFLGVAAVLGTSRPSVWSFPLLTKIAPGVGMLWLLGRRDYRALIKALLCTLAIVTASLVVSPDDWRAWWRWALADSGQGQLLFPLRLACAAAIALWAGYRDRIWPLGLVLLLACPIFQDLSPLTVLVCLPRLVDRDRLRDEQTDTSTSAHAGDHRT